MKQSKEFQPQMHADDTGVNRLSERVIGYAFQVINTLGARRWTVRTQRRPQLTEGERLAPLPAAQLWQTPA
jgi:hypothetical protein